jgi:DNA-directed RNA polymerase specialized sigma24 family protein
VKVRPSGVPRKASNGNPAKLCMSSTELDEFYRKVTLPLLRRARWRHGLSRDDAWDIVQDAFLLAIERIESAKNPNAWIIQVVDHLALNHNRKITRRIRLQAQWNPVRRGSSEDADSMTQDDRSDE